MGDGPERQSLEQSAKSKGLNVRFIGPVDYDKLAPYYAAADAFIIPTLEDNWSLVVPEAMACGLPILCSKYNGCWPELVQEGRNGWVFDPLDPADTVRCLAQCARLKAESRKQKAESAEACADAPTHRRPDAPATADQFQLSAFQHFSFQKPSILQQMGEQSREILKDHTPRKAAEAIYRACEIAIKHRSAKALTSALPL